MSRLHSHLWYWDWIKKRIVPLHPPEFIYLDVFDGCDAECRFCAAGKRTGLPMEPELYKHIVNETASLGVKELSLSTNGEPALHPNLPGLVALARESGLRVYFATGGFHITKELAQELVRADISGVAVSLETLNQGNPIPQSWDDALAAVNSLLESRGNALTPRLTVLLPLAQDTPKSEFYRLNKVIHDRLHHSPDGILALRRHDWHGKYTGAQVGAARPHFACQHPWRGLYLGRSGEVLTCYFDPDQTRIVDSICNKPMKEVWLGTAMQSLRIAQAKQELGDYLLCRMCRLPDRATPLSFAWRTLIEQWRFRRQHTRLNWYF